jgi:amino acid adenylation domain-containing protein
MSAGPADADPLQLPLPLSEKAISPRTNTSTSKEQLNYRWPHDLRTRVHLGGKDWTSWKVASMQGDELKFWREQLTGLEKLELPTDHPRPLERSGAGSSVRFTVPAQTTRRLGEVAAGQGAQLFMAGLAGFQVVLSRWSGQDDIAVGSPIVGRNRAEGQDGLGSLVNTLVLRTDTSGNPSFEELLGRVRETVLGAYAHQDLPIESLVKELAPTRDLSRNPLFRIGFQLHTTGEYLWKPPNLAVQPGECGAPGATLDLSVTLAQQPDDSLEGQVVFSAELFEEATAQRLASNYLRVLQQVTADPGQPIGQVDLLTTAERRRILEDWNDTAVPFADDITVHQLVEEQAARTPDAIAVVCGDNQLTYSQLNTRANQLAHHLGSVGVTAESRVAVCLERGVDMVIALLGVLKAGGAYVPLDPEYPRERLQFMLRDTQPPLLVATTGTLSALPENDIPLVVLDEPATIRTLARRHTNNPDPRSGPHNLAYIIYTSGSTGAPKGVMIEHQGVVNYLEFIFRSVLAQHDFGPILQTASISQDASVREIFGGLCAGAKIIVAPAKALADPKGYVEQLLAAGAKNIIACVPSALEPIVKELAGVNKTVRLGTVLVTGERISQLRHMDGLIRGCTERLVNHYGPTECTITSSFSLSHDLAKGDQIGRPIANTELFVMDRFGGLAPVGVPGELWIGGVGVARGYWNRPELTAERFVQHPFSDDPSARVYRTGDLARWLPDGVLEFLGRMDHQVKLRGLRIELGEIESVLASHESVASSVVVVREDEPGDKRLVAYCVAAPDQQLDVSVLRQWCRRSLLENMTPSSLVFLDELPLTPNGKVDRRALPVPDRARPERGQDFVSPRTEIEELIAGVWAEVLGLDRVGVHDNFFDLGGHSLQVALVINKIQLLTKARVDLRVFFATPTVAAFGDHVVELVAAFENSSTSQHRIELNK